MRYPGEGKVGGGPIRPASGKEEACGKEGRESY